MGDKVFACSGGFIRGYNLSNGANIFNLNVGGTFLNGLSSDGVNFLYATDFSAKKIFKIDVLATTFTTIATGLVKTPNGILCEPENNRCLFVNWGTNAPISAINLTTNIVTTVLATTLGNCDGITKDSCGNYYVTSWGNNKLNKFNASLTGTFTVIPGTLSSPADIDCRFGSTFDTVGIPGGGSISFPEILRPNPVITNGSNLLTTTTTFDLYQWYFNDTPILGANSQTFQAVNSGFYYCQITQGTCSLSSNTIEVTVLANKNFADNRSFKLYPNPSSEILFLELQPTSNVSYVIFDTLGKELINGQNNNKEKVAIDIGKLSSGSYFIKIASNEGVQTRGFLKK